MTRPGLFAKRGWAIGFAVAFALFAAVGIERLGAPAPTGGIASLIGNLGVTILAIMLAIEPILPAGERIAWVLATALTTAELVAHIPGAMTRTGLTAERVLVSVLSAGISLAALSCFLAARRH